MAESKTLMQLESEARQVVAEIMDAEGEVDERLEAMLDSVEKGLEVKSNGYAAVIRRFEAEAEYHEKLAAQVYKVAESHRNAAERMLSRIKATMLRIERPTMGPFKVYKTKAVVNIENEALVPVSYIKTKLMESFDKKMIYEALSKGIAVPGTSLADNYAIKADVITKAVI